MAFIHALCAYHIARDMYTQVFYIDAWPVLGLDRQEFVVLI